MVFSNGSNDILISIYGGVALIGGVVDTFGPEFDCIDLKLKPGFKTVKSS